MISVIGYTHIYQLTAGGVGLEGNVDINKMQSADNDAETKSQLWFLLGTTVSTMFVGAIAGAVAGSFLLKIPTSEGIAYGFFAGLITDVFIHTTVILGSMTSIVPQPQVQFILRVVVALFLGITGIMFAIGFMQLIRGSIQTMT